jgi:hypothetical protein
MQDDADHRALVREVWADVPAQGPPEVRIDVASSAGPLCIVYRSHRAMAARGTTLDKGASVGITVCAFRTTVSNVVQLDYASASQHMTGRKLTPRRYERASVACRNTVVSTEPAAGKQVLEGSVVQIFVSSGTAPTGHNNDDRRSRNCAN